MKIHRVQIEQQAAKIRVDSQMAALSIRTPKRTMQVEEQHAQMQTESRAPQVELDLEAFKANLGLQSVLDSTRENAARAQEQVEQSIREFAQQEDAVATLPSYGNSIARAARDKMLEDRTPDLCSGQVPDGAIPMKGDPGDVQIDWSKHELSINWDEYQRPVISVEPKPSVEIQLEQEPQISCTVVELSIPPETGREIDAKA